MESPLYELWGLNSGCQGYPLSHPVSPIVAKFNKVMLLLDFFLICLLFMARGTGFPLVLSGFSLKYISLSTDWIAGPNDDVAEESVLGRSCLLAEEQHCYYMPLPF